MPQCPQCNKTLKDLPRRCPTCQADLDLLVDFVGHLQGGIDRAESLVREGNLGDAFWAYMEVLEVDPDNPQARLQVGQVVTAVRQFDRVAEGRKWMNDYRQKNGIPLWVKIAMGCTLIVLAFGLGVLIGNIGSRLAGETVEENPNPLEPPAPLIQPANKLGK